MTNKHVYGMFSVLGSPLNHTQTNQNKVMPLTYRVEFENKIKNIEKQNTERENKDSKSTIFSRGIGINYVHSYNYYQQMNSTNNNNNNNNNNTPNKIKTRTITNYENVNINRNLGWGGRENRFFSLSAMRNGGGCGCG